MADVKLYGRVVITGRISAVTGLHIGGSPTALAIGTVDNPVIRDTLTGRPYIPGSSVRGKMRSLWEKVNGSPQNMRIGRDVYIHVCAERQDYARCPVCQIYGVPGQLDASSPTRLVVRDTFLSEASAQDLMIRARTDLPYTEVKWEAAIDRVTSAAVPRQMERVPAGAVFEGLEMVFSLYEAGDIERFVDVFRAMQLLEDDYLGGQGSRGSGKIRFEGLSIVCRNSETYEKVHEWSKYLSDQDPNKWPEKGIQSVQQVLDMKDDLIAWLKKTIEIPEAQPTP